jgi:hypothetical protein
MTYDPYRNQYRIEHDPSGDEAEAVDRASALLAARTLLADNEFSGQCRIFEGPRVLDMVWADNESSYTHIGGR